MRLASLLDLPVDPHRAAWLRRMLAAFTLSMLAATWRLWTVQSDFPRVPLVRAAAWCPAAFEWLLAALLVGGLVVAAISHAERTWRRCAAHVCRRAGRFDRAGPAPIATLGLAVDARRNGSGQLPGRDGFALIRLLTVSIYLYSGLSKLDYEFLHTLGQQFVTTLLGFVGASADAWPQPWRLLAAASLPLAEIILACGFCFRQLWPAALIASVLLHGLLVVVLGPWALHHSLAVLLWNGYFIGQNILLFARPAAGATNRSPSSPAEASDHSARSA